MKKPLPVIENVLIEDFAAEGKSLARVDGGVIFVPFTIPGDVVDVQLVKRRRAWSEGRVVNYRKMSDVRVQPACEDFGICGGCRWQMLPYEVQLEMKERQVRDQLERIGGLELPPLRKIVGSEQIYEYRNKLEFGCSDRRWLTKEQMLEGDVRGDVGAIGFHISGVWDKVLPVKSCRLMHPLADKVREDIDREAKSLRMSFWNGRRCEGLLRDIVIRCSNSGEWMLIVQFNITQEYERELAMTLLGRVKEATPQLSSILWVENSKLNDTFGDLPVHVYHGSAYMTAWMEDLKFRVGPKSFYQTNTAGALRLYNVVRSMADLKGNEVVYDLYTGTGTIALFVARSAAKVVGIEYVNEAIEDAKVNAEMNHIDNVAFFAGDMKDVLTEDFIERKGAPDVIIADPPRAGMHGKVIERLLCTGAKRLVYVSCNPATQARDLALLAERYVVRAAQPVDMFPHTPHVENVVLLELR